MIFALTTALLLGQAEAEPGAEPAPAPAAAAPAAPSAASPASGERVAPRALSPEALQREMERIGRLPPEEAARAATDLQQRMPKADMTARPRLPAEPVIPEVKNYAALPEEEQVKYSAREFFTQLIAGDARNITNNCGLPFQLEERRLQTADELFQEWLRNLRAKRTDLLTLYDIEVLTPADMEKKYGKPPARLQSLPWRGQKTYVAVANLSGRAAIAVFRYTGMNWAVVAYAD